MKASGCKMKCLDTYALVEIHDQNPNFINYLDEDFVIPELVMAEFYSLILRDYNEKTANYLFKRFEPFISPVGINLMIKAVKYRYENRKQNLSFFDCVGYIFARENGMKFVTGDKEFENKEGVEFIKK